MPKIGQPEERTPRPPGLPADDDDDDDDDDNDDDDIFKIIAFT